MNARIAQTLMRGGEPQSLTDEELELATEPVTRTPKPEKVRAWVRYEGQPILIDAMAVAWTSHAVAVQWPTETGELHRAWVWSSAVRPDANGGLGRT